MSTRILSAYFDDVRKGRKDVALIRQFLLDTYDRDPVKRGHLLNWLDQAQYEHPIPVTDFLILRKEVEAALNSSRQRTPQNDATVLADQVIAPDAVTIAATAATTVATHGPDQTLAADEGATRIDHSRDITPLPERSDHAGLHNAATTLRPPALDTDILSPPPLSPGKSRTVSRRFLLGSALTLALIALAGVIGLRFWLKPSVSDSPASNITTADVNHVLNHSPAGSIGTPPIQEPHGSEKTVSEHVIAEPVDLERLSEAELQQEISTRTAAGDLLPISDPASVHAALQVLERRFPGSDFALQARIAIKNAHLKQSDMAREKGEWELAQQHLDAAFEVLQQAAEQHARH